MQISALSVFLELIEESNNAEEVERTKEYNSDWDHSVEKTVEEEYKGRAKSIKKKLSTRRM